MSHDQLSTMEEEALKRKERLKALKSASKARTDNDDATDAADKKPKFRSYKPNDESILENATVAEPETVDLQAAVQSQLDLLQQPIVIDEIGIANLAPRKPDWDLKRDVAKKLERLEHRTQRAIAELIRERLRNSSQLPADMLEGVNMGASAAAAGDTQSKVILNRADDE